MLDPRTPTGPIETKWSRHKDTLRLVSPAGKRKYKVIVVGTGLAGASAAATLGELGYSVQCFCYQDSPRRAHSISAQGGINAAKDYQADGDSVHRLFCDTLKGGDFRSREANVYRLAELSGNIIDQCVAQGVPFARDYAGYLDNRSFGGAQVSRTFYARGQTGQQLLLGAYGALMRQVASGTVKVQARSMVLDIVTRQGEAMGVTVRDMVSGRVSAYAADAVCLASGGYSNVYFLSTNAAGSNVSALMSAYRKGAHFANPCYTQIHPTCLPATGHHQSKLTLMSESLRNDGRVWVPKAPGDRRAPREIPEAERDYYLERKYPSYGNLAPRDISSRAAKEVCDLGQGVGPTGRGVYLDFAGAVERLGVDKMRERYGNLFEMYERITGQDAYGEPMRIYPAPHYTMGGLWVDYNLESSLKGLFILGEANFSDHGANRLGASALMQGLADGYFIVPHTISDRLARIAPGRFTGQEPEFRESCQSVEARCKAHLSHKGRSTASELHRDLGAIMWDKVGMSRSREGLRAALNEIPSITERFRSDLLVPGGQGDLNQELDRALRVEDFLEVAGLMARDALLREESSGGHFRIEHQSAEGEALRDDLRMSHVAAWRYTGQGAEPVLVKEPLVFEALKPSERSYK